jgi:hypothetical protein
MTEDADAGSDNCTNNNSNSYGSYAMARCFF